MQVAGLMLSEVTQDNPAMYNDVREGQWGATYAIRPELQVSTAHGACGGRTLTLIT